MNKSLQETLSKLKFTHLNISTTLNENFYGKLDSLNEGSLVLKESNEQLKIINLDHIVSITILNK